MRGRNGVIMAYPSTHPEGGEYRWLRAGSVPELPGYVAELLDDQGASEDAADDERVRAFLDQHVDEARPELLDILLSCVEEQLATKGTASAVRVMADDGDERGCVRVLRGESRS